MTVFLDTNVLIYSTSEDPADVWKRPKAQALLDRDDVVLSMQTLQEFIVNTTKVTRPYPMPISSALAYVRVWRRFPIQETTLPVLDDAMALLQRHKMAFWDSTIVAAARAQGCDTLYSEDMQDGRIIDRLRIVNPFV
jgi:predicted nucleic acid-binding protein